MGVCMCPRIREWEAHLWEEGREGGVTLTRIVSIRIGCCWEETRLRMSLPISCVCVCVWRGVGEQEGAVSERGKSCCLSCGNVKVFTCGVKPRRSWNGNNFFSCRSCSFFFRKQCVLVQAGNIVSHFFKKKPSELRAILDKHRPCLSSLSPPSHPLILRHRLPISPALPCQALWDGGCGIGP